MNKLLVAVLGPWMFIDPSNGDTLENHRPSLVSQTPFVTARVKNGEIGVLANNIDPEATDEQVEKAYAKAEKDKDGKIDNAAFAKAFASKHKAKVDDDSALAVSGQDQEVVASPEDKKKAEEEAAKAAEASRISELKSKLTAAKVTFKEDATEKELQDLLADHDEVTATREKLTVAKIEFKDTDTLAQLKAKLPKA